MRGSTRSCAAIGTSRSRIDSSAANHLSRRPPPPGVNSATSGLLIGVAAATALARVMIAALDFVAPPDAPAYGAVAMILLAVAAAAVFVPARRAMRVDPVRTLRAN